MPSADTETETGSEQGGPVDEGRSALLEAVTAELGDAVVDTRLIAGRDLWIRVDTAAWAATADYLRNRQRFRFFDFLSAIDWLPSPYGRSLNAAVDLAREGADLTAEEVPDVEVDSNTQDEPDTTPATETAPTETGEPVEVDTTGTGAASHAGGATRFQVLARVYSLTTKLGITVKTDVGDDPAVGTWTGVYPGADWHERETWEMFGIRFIGHPGLRHLYLPGDFEGHPLRKDFPLLSRLVKPWPGIVDVEPMPQAPDEAPEESGS